ncbi:MAG TPA: hypothetical protein ENI92_10010 [Bacteroidetes bacterium]|nr:hypothetical protein [Bacteroidota bacterium]
MITTDAVSPPEELLSALDDLPRPRISDISRARPALWEILSDPRRDRGLRWLDHHGLLEELIPCWAGHAKRRQLRLDAVEQVHREEWRKGLSGASYNRICDELGQVVDGRLNRWALTALATLLGGGDIENHLFWTKEVRRDLFALGATEAEIVSVERIVAELNRVVQFLRGVYDKCSLTPGLAVAGLSTLRALDGPEGMKEAVRRADTVLAETVNPLDAEEETIDEEEK